MQPTTNVSVHPHNLTSQPTIHASPASSQNISTTTMDCVNIVPLTIFSYLQFSSVIDALLQLLFSMEPLVLLVPMAHTSISPLMLVKIVQEGNTSTT